MPEWLQVALLGAAALTFYKALRAAVAWLARQVTKQPE